MAFISMLGLLRELSVLEMFADSFCCLIPSVVLHSTNVNDHIFTTKYDQPMLDAGLNSKGYNNDNS